MELHVLRRHGWSIAALAREFGLDGVAAFGVPTAQLIAGSTVVGAAAILVIRHLRRPREPILVQLDTGQAPSAGEMAHD